MRLVVLVSVFLLAACAASGAAVTGAVINTAIAGTASGISRANGGCYAACPDGTTCTRATGMCDAIPCRGLCATNQRCDQTGPLERCVPAAQVDLKLEPPPPERKAPQ